DGVQESRRGTIRKSPERRGSRDFERGPGSNRVSRKGRRLPMRSLSLIHEAEASPATRLAISLPDAGVPHAGSATADGAALEDAYRTVRRCTEALCEPLA